MSGPTYGRVTGRRTSVDVDVALFDVSAIRSSGHGDLMLPVRTTLRFSTKADGSADVLLFPITVLGVAASATVVDAASDGGTQCSRQVTYLHAGTAPEWLLRVANWARTRNVLT